MGDRLCNTCQYFRQHYTFDKQKLFRVYCGHCTYQKPKNKRPDAKACQYYTAVDPDEKPFVAKEYLTAVLLEYMLKLELLPEIHETDEKIRG